MQKEKLRVALVLTPIGLGGYRDVGMKESLPHIGVAYLAGNVPPEIATVRIFDGPAEQMTPQELSDTLVAFRPDVVGFTSLTFQITDVHEAARRVKEQIPGAVTVLGGYHASAIPNETIQRFPSFDVAVCGEGERTFGELIGAIYDGRTRADWASISGLCYLNDGVAHCTPARPFIEDLDSLRFPAYDLMPLDRYAGFYTPFFTRTRRTVLLSTGRGCPCRCIFCYKASGDRYRVRSIPSVLDELRRNIHDFQIQEFVISDESFLQKPERVRQFCDTILAEGIQKKVKWICQGRVDHANPDILKLMARAGCRVIAYGIESGNLEVLKKIKKGITTDQAINAIRWTKQAGILTDTNFILGHPYETRESIYDTIRLALRTGSDMASFAIMVPFPGTEIARMARNGEGGLRLLSEDYATYGKQVGGALELESVPRAEMERLQRIAYIRFYLRPSKILNLFRVVSAKMLILMLLHAVRTKKT